jgi:hypothetical protein
VNNTVYVTCLFYKFSLDRIFAGIFQKLFGEIFK